MTCHDVEERLPLHAGGDLPEDEALAVLRHLAGCERCRGLGAALAESRAWLASAPPLEMPESFHSSVRGEVMRRLAEPAAARRLPLAWTRPCAFTPARSAALAAAALVALAMGLASAFLGSRAEREARTAVARGAAVSAIRQAPDVTVAVPPAAGAQRDRVSPSSTPESAPRRAARRAPRRRRPPPERPPASRVASIEITTGRPDIRIIWLASASPDSTTDRQEVPVP